ncbi:MAG: quinolinate synthase NadA [Rhodospirillaceae bacterium]|mgnify:FL=1|nr:quinolinate synthase NadA [Rhodospirillales bacterium]MBT3906207.1 quinolinate synthase NadA [Rhodospirillaceae bacterium]MBT4702001.1 quinolinate synthase NadA [Rhodospirillaceae bacterium]MBT5034717.1 quinolinate synthase NadA [Rhodospirillaceae bacterium]MBT6221482.1 quinolinate synthase NadA [Rhodospirillaceae bacterium]
MTDTVVLPAADAVTEGQVDPYLDLEAEIKRLRQEKNAVILAHYYQDPEIQDIADFVGDSLDLSRKAASTDADVIIFCGVRFMAEVAKILNPSKLVLLPDAEAGCSLEDSCQPDEFRAFREKHPDHVAISYINCSADVKALSDIICTSSNAEAIIHSIPKDQPILFAPDKHLGAYLARKCGREITLWPGTCLVHDQFSERELVKLKTRHADAMVAAHPECPEAILKYADHVGSTKGILDYVINDPHDTFIVATEQHIIHQMEKGAPGKTFIAAPGADGTCNCANCPFMEMNTMEKLYLALLNEAPRVELPEDLRKKAQEPLNKMMKLSPPPVKQAQAAAE